MGITYEKNAVDKAQEYYNSPPADQFYFNIWGGEHIHVGIYHHPEESIKDASPRIIEMMASKLSLGKQTAVLDLGSGYGGAARYLAERFGCQVTCLNLSETQNKRNISLNKRYGLDHLITVVEGSFEEIPYPNRSFDVVWSQDAFVHSSDREALIDQISDVLKESGELIFTDLMQTYDCPKSILEPILDRIHLDSLASFGFYTDQARKLKAKEAMISDLSKNLTTHYHRVMEETQKRYDEMVGICGKEYIEKMIQGLKHWIKAGQANYLSWGIIDFKR